MLDQNRSKEMNILNELEEKKNNCAIEIGSCSIRCNISGKFTPFVLESPVFM